MHYIRSNFGNDGYAVWFMLLEQLGKSDYHYLDLSNKMEIMYLSSEFMVSEEKLTKIISVLVEFGEFDKELWEENSILFNEKFVSNVKDAYSKRKNECITRNELLIRLGLSQPSLFQNFPPKEPKRTLNDPGSTHSIVKDSIVNKTAVKSARKPNPVWDMICKIWNMDPVTKSDKSRLGKLSRDFTLKLKGANSENIKSLKEIFENEWKGTECTPEALLKHWDRFKPVVQKKPEYQEPEAPMRIVRVINPHG